MAETNSLSEREQEILQLVATGLTNREIAQSLTISPNTVKVHLRNIFDKIEVSSRTEATMYGIEHGIVDIPGSEENSIQPGSLSMVQKLPWVFMVIVLVAALLVAVGGNFLFPPTTPTPNPLSAVPDRWQDLATMPEPRAGMAAATYNGNIYAIAGEGLEGVSGSVFRYITPEDRWEQLTEKPTPVTDVDGVLLGEKIYIPGGRLEDGENTDVLEVYDPRRDTWEQKAPLPIKISGYALAEFEGEMYLFGGWDGEKVVDIALRYDLQEDVWEYVTSMPTARAYAGAAEAGGKIYVIGGWDGNNSLDVNEGYVPAREEEEDLVWEEEVNFPEPNKDLSVESIAEMLFVVINDGVWQYEIQDKLWIAYPNFSNDIKISSGVTNLEGNIFLFGGYNEDGLENNALLKFQAIYTFALPNINR